MAFDVELSPDLQSKLENAARLHGQTPEHMVLLAIAEKLARLEHEEWLSTAQAAREAQSNSGTAAIAAPGEVSVCVDKQSEDK